MKEMRLEKEKAQHYYNSPSGELKFWIYAEEKIIVSQYGNLRDVSTKEYMAYMQKIGEKMNEYNVGKMFLDQSLLSNFSISLRALAVNNIVNLVLKPAPFFLLAILKSRSAFDNMATQTALKAAKPLSKKFLDGKIFDTETEALSWLLDFEVPAEFK